MAPRVEAVYAAMEASVGAEFIQGVYATLDQLVARLGVVDGDEGVD
jgi:hypothetical protein